MWPVVEQWVLAPLLVLTAAFQLTLAALTQTTVFICIRACSTSPLGAISLADDPLLFYVALTEAVVFLGWAVWIYAKKRP